MLRGVPCNGPFVGLRRKKRKEKRSPFYAVAALRRAPEGDGVFEAAVLASSYPGSVQLRSFYAMRRSVLRGRI